MLYFFISQGYLHPLHAWSRVPSSVHWYGVENTNIQKVLYTFPGRGEVPTAWDVQCNTAKSRESLVTSKQTFFLVTRPFVKTKIQNSQYIAYIAHPNPSPGTGTRERFANYQLMWLY